MALKAVGSILAVTIAAAMIVWVLYNELIERQPEYQRVQLVGGLFGIAPIMLRVGWLWGRQAFAR